jgi:hypothetical protein
MTWKAASFTSPTPTLSSFGRGRRSPIELGFVNDDFTRNLLTLRAELRAALAVYQPTAVRYGDLLA